MCVCVRGFQQITASGVPAGSQVRAQHDLDRERVRGGQGRRSGRLRRQSPVWNDNVHGWRCRQVRPLQLHRRDERRWPLHREGDARRPTSNATRSRAPSTLSWAPMEWLGTGRIGRVAEVRPLLCRGNCRLWRRWQRRSTEDGVDGRRAGGRRPVVRVSQGQSGRRRSEDGTGTSHSEFGTSGRMAGAFGATRQ